MLSLLWFPGAIRAQQVETVGVPWAGEPGVKEFVRDIMARERAGGSEPSEPPAHRRGRSDRSNLPQDPDAPKIPKWPPVSSAQSKGIGGSVDNPSTDAPVEFDASQTTGTNFVAATYTDSLNVPPSPMGAVSPTQILIGINGRVRTFTKSGVLDGSIDTTSDNFFNSVRNSAGTTDPRVVFDRLSQRWFVSMINKQSAPNRIMIAVSNEATITSDSSFTFFQFQHDLAGTIPNADTGQFADFPSLGVDNNALYIGVNVFDPSLTTYKRSSVFVINKAVLLAGSLMVTAFRQVATASIGGPFSPLGVTNMDPNATEGYFIGVNTTSFGALRIRRISNPGGTPSLSDNIALTIPSTVRPIGVPAQGSNLPLDQVDDRLMNAQIFNGSLWTTHSIQVDSMGVANQNGGRNGMRFYEIVNMTTAPTLRQAGTLFDNATTNPQYFWVGSVATSGQGHTVLASSYASSTAFAGVAFNGRLLGDDLGTLNAVTERRAGSGAYNLESGPATFQRWGDYTNVVVDPADNMTMWTFQEEANATNSWGVLVTQRKAPRPATPSTASPSSAFAGATLDLTITGVSTAGSGFYDPGSGFPNRLSAKVDGDGVTVNRLIYNNPASITLNVTIAANAPPGSRTATVTNPDGQVATSPTGIFTINLPPITLSPVTLPDGTTGVAYNQVLTASGAPAPYTFSVQAGALAAGLVLNPSTGAITGTPSAAGTASFTIQVVNTLGSAGSRPYTLNVFDNVSNNLSQSVTSTLYNSTPVPGFVGRFTINTLLTNIGVPISSPMFFRVTALDKVGIDQNPAQPNMLLSADNTVGVVGDIQTLPLALLGMGESVPVSFLIGMGARQRFTITLDLYGVLSGNGMSADEATFKGVKHDPHPGRMNLLKRFQFESPAVSPPWSRGPSVLALDPISNGGIITGPGAQSRPAVAVDPVVPRRMAVASNDYAAQSIAISTTQDGGKTWNTTTLSRSLPGYPPFYTAQNPSLAFDSVGRLSVVYSLSNRDDAANAIVISESSDGLHFNPPAAITFHPALEGIIDSRPVIAIKAGAGSYVSWDSVSYATGRYSIQVARSEEGGLFGPAATVVSNALVSSPTLALSKSAVYIGWDDWGFNSKFPYNSGGRLMYTSAPPGSKLKFDSPAEIARTGIGFAQRIAAMPEQGAGPNLSLAVDPKREDIVYAVFADRGNGIDIRFAESMNRGKTWQLVTVNNDAGFADQFSPAIAADSDTHVNISFYDTRLSSTLEKTHVVLARTSKGDSFDFETITTHDSNDSKSNPLRDYTANLGDRSAIAATARDVVIAWTDTRQNSEDIFLSVVEVKP